MGFESLVPDDLANKNADRLTAARASARLVGMAGFEPTASASRTQRSTKLSHIPAREILPNPANNASLNDNFFTRVFSWP